MQEMRDWEQCIFPEDMDDAASSISNTSAVTGSRLRGKQPAKTSGREDAVGSVIVPANRQLWPQTALPGSVADRRIKYDDLSIQLFVAGFVTIMLKSDITQDELQGRLKLLRKLMFYADTYLWKVILNLHAAIVLEIER